MSDGNGAREVVDRYFAEETELPPEMDGQKFARADHLLAWLWNEGFIVATIKAIEGDSKASHG